MVQLTDGHGLAGRRSTGWGGRLALSAARRCFTGCLSRVLMPQVMGIWE